MDDVASKPAPAPLPVSEKAATFRLFHPDPEEDGHWDWLAKELGEDSMQHHPEPLEAVLEIAKELGCRTVVVEERYVDLDYRSEFSAFWSRRFEDRPPLARRAHFFAAELDPDSLHQLPADPGYLGYSILRPAELGPVGRTVLRPPPRVGETAVLCTVEDRVNFFGNELTVRGVPFVQQDSEFLRCGHAAAWVCHYVAQGRGLIGRRTTAEIAQLPSVDGSAHRPLPSNGVTGEQIQKIFSASGLPAFFYDIEDLPDPPALLPKPPPDPVGRLAGRTARREARERAEQRWEGEMHREQLLRIACKYINSGFPIVVLMEGSEHHAFTLVGWEKVGDRVRLYACDDMVGPYEPIDDVLADQAEHGAWVGLMLPLPEKVFLTGEAAEQRAWGIPVASRNIALEKASVQERDFAAVGERLGHLKAGVSVRSMLIEGRELKLRMEDGGRDGDALALYRLAHLPHWVWLVEFHDPEARDRGQPCVLAEVVLDSSSHDEAPQTLLSMTTSQARDQGAIRRGDPGPNEADGPGGPWESLILRRDADAEPRLAGAEQIA